MASGEKKVLKALKAALKGMADQGVKRVSRAVTINGEVLKVELAGGGAVGVAVRAWPEHPEGAVSYTDGRVDWCLKCSSPDDVEEYGLRPVTPDGLPEGAVCETCGERIDGGSEVLQDGAS